MKLKRSLKKLFSRRAYFKAASQSNLVNGWIMAPVTIDRQLYADNRKIRARARELELNSPHVRQYLALLCDNVVGPQGFKLSDDVEKQIEQLLDEPIDLVVTVCDNANETCPVFPRPVKRIHVPFHDPHGESLESFAKVRNDIRKRLVPAVREALGV